MRTAVAIASIFLALVLLGPARAEEWPMIPARLSLIEGEVLVQTPESPDWFLASSNLPVGPGDRVWVGAGGRTEVQLPEGNLARLGSETIVDLRSLSNPGALESRIGLERGVAFFYIRRPQSSRGVFRVELPQASLRPSPPSSFRSELFPDGSMQVAVYSGEVIVETPGGATRVHGQQSLRLGPDLIPHLLALAQGDDFDRWNNLRDLELSRADSPPYLSPELAAYAPDFSAYGRWVSVPENGYAWAPVVEASWTPFSEGRWIWWRGEHVWISDEPWGWVPYHYGRWRFYPAVGWVWIPPVATAVIWHPGAVAWFYGPEFVAWLPLAPGEMYYGHRHYGPWSVNITNVHVNTVHVTNVFINAKATKAVVVVPRERFVTGERAPASFVPPRNVFASGGGRSQGPPPIRPLRAAARPAPPRPINTPSRRSAESFGPVLAPSLERRVIEVDARPPVAKPNPSVFQSSRASRRIPSKPLPQVSPPAPTLRPKLGEGVNRRAIAPPVIAPPPVIGSPPAAMGGRRDIMAAPPAPGLSSVVGTSRRAPETGQLRSVPATRSLPPSVHVAASRQITPAHGRPAHAPSSSQPPHEQPAFTVQMRAR